MWSCTQSIGNGFHSPYEELKINQKFWSVSQSCMKSKKAVLMVEKETISVSECSMFNSANDSFTILILAW